MTLDDVYGPDQDEFPLEQEAEVRRLMEEQETLDQHRLRRQLVPRRVVAILDLAPKRLDHLSTQSLARSGSCDDRHSSAPET